MINLQWNILPTYIEYSRSVTRKQFPSHYCHYHFFFATDEPIKILRVTDYTATSDVPIGKGYYAVSKIIYTNKSASKILGRKKSSTPLTPHLPKFWDKKPKATTNMTIRATKYFTYPWTNFVTESHTHLAKIDSAPSLNVVLFFERFIF